MATGNISDFIIYDEEMGNAYIEMLKQKVEVFNQASGGAIVISSESILGDLQKQSFFKSLASIATAKHRDPTSLADIVADKLEQGEKIGVKVNRYSFIQNTLDAFKKIGEGEQTFSEAVGFLTAMASVEDQVNTAIHALMGAVQAEPTHILGNKTTPTEMTFKDVNSLRFVYGDNFNGIKVLIMHSSSAEVFTNLNIDEKLDSVGGITIQTAKIGSLGIPVLVTDSPAFAMTVGKGVMALVDGACVVVDSEEVTADVQRVQGKANLVLSMQREWAFNIAIKGFSYTGAVHPDNTALALPANWTKTATSNKDLAGAIYNTAT